MAIPTPFPLQIQRFSIGLTKTRLYAVYLWHRVSSEDYPYPIQLTMCRTFMHETHISSIHDIICEL